MEFSRKTSFCGRFGIWYTEVLELVQKWKAIAILSCATDKLDYVWNSLTYNVPVDNWRSTAKNGILASIHVYKDENSKKRVVKHLISTAFTFTNILFQAIDMIPLDIEKGVNLYKISKTFRNHAQIL